MEHAELRQTTFGEVLAELMEARGLEATPFQVGLLGEKSGLDGWQVLGRMTDAGAEDPGDLGGLADALGLSESERLELAFSYAFERRLEETLAENTDE